MNVVAHNALILALVLGSLVFLGRRARPGQTGPSSQARLALGLEIGLAFACIASTVAFGGDLFGMAQLGAWSVFLHVPLYLLGLAVLFWKDRPALSRGLVAVVAAIALIALDAFVIEPHWLDVNTVTVTSAKLNESMRVVVIADIQTDRPGPYEARVLETAMDQSPDLILFAGDYIHLGRKSQCYEEEIAALRELLLEADVHAPLGIYAIAGNVDRSGQWTHIFDGLPATTIETTTGYDLGSVKLTGLAMMDAFGVELDLPTEDQFHIVMGHSPNFALSPGTGDLLIAGHTHGGQVRLPFIGPPLTLTVVPRSWASGVTEIDADTTLIVSRGIGMERAAAPRLRFLCRPELVVVDLVPQ